MNFRHEWKHPLNSMDLQETRSRLRCVMRPDPHAGASGKYEVRSLYFDSPGDSALREKLDGISRREKFRMRFYNGDVRLIHLEKKSKIDGLCRKQPAALTAGEAQSIVDGAWEWMPSAENRPLLLELYTKMRTRGLRPKTIVDYTREPFVYAPGNVRVTLDYALRTGLRCTDFLNTRCVTVPAGDAPAILEVKWDAFLRCTDFTELLRPADAERSGPAERQRSLHRGGTAHGPLRSDRRAAAPPVGHGRHGWRGGSGRLPGRGIFPRRVSAWGRGGHARFRKSAGADARGPGLAAYAEGSLLRPKRTEANRPTSETLPSSDGCVLSRSAAGHHLREAVSVLAPSAPLRPF